MPKTNRRKWCEETAKEFGCSLKQIGKYWVVTQKSSKKEVFRSKYLLDVQNFFLNQIMKVIGKRLKIRGAK